MPPSLLKSGFQPQSLKIQYKPDTRVNPVWLSSHSSNTAIDARPLNYFIRLPEGLTLWRYLPPNLTSLSLLGSCNSAWPSRAKAKCSKYLCCSESEQSQKTDKPYLLPCSRRTLITVHSGFCSKAQRGQRINLQLSQRLQSLLAFHHCSGRSPIADESDVP